MGLSFFIGASGSGKSQQLYQNIIKQSMEFPKRNFLIIVPDQFTMQTQKDICVMHPRGGIMNIDVLSFGRLSHRIFEEVGGNDKPILDDTGKSLILRKVAAIKMDNLTVISKNLKKIGYIHEVKSAISEFMQYGVDVKGVGELVIFASQKGALSHKLKDLAILYQGFIDYNKDKFITTEESLTLLTSVLKKSSIIRDSVVVFDGFTGFTPIQNQVLGELMTLAREVIVTITLSEEVNPFELEGEQKLFYLSQKTIKSLEELAKEVNCPRSKDLIIKGYPVYRYRNNKVLAHLEKQLFRYQNNPYQEDCKSLSIIEAKNPNQEVKQVCIGINSLIREKGYRYQDIAVVTGDLTNYANYVEQEFEKFGIPFFLDNTKGILLNPFIECVKSVLEIILRGYSYEAMFHYLKSGMSPLSQTEIDLLENYVLAYGIRGASRWNVPFTRKPKWEEEEEEALIAINESREKIKLILTGLDYKKSTAKEFAISLYEFMVSTHLQERLTTYERQYEAKGNLAKAKEYAQIYHLVMDLLNQIVELLGEEEMTLQEFAEILYAGFDEIQVGIIPQNVDQVVVGDIERTRLKGIKALFFMGINDGIIPKNASSGGIISDIDREFLKEGNYELAPTPRQQMYIQRLYLYMNMTKPKEYLTLSYSLVDGSGKSIRPAYLVRSIEQLFPKLVVEKVDDTSLEKLLSTKENSSNLEKLLSTKEDGIDYLIMLLRHYAKGRSLLTQNDIDKEKKFLTIFSWYQNQPEYERLIKQLLKASFYFYEESPLSKIVANALYGQVLENSVSRLEQYAACAYSHFLRYGLQLKEREEFSFERVDMGNVFHGALENFAQQLVESKYTWFDFNETAGKEMVEASLFSYIQQFGEEIFYHSARNEYLINRMKRILERTVTTLQYQLKKGSFKPSQFELSFSMLEDLASVNVSLSAEEKIRLLGRIDRVDIYEDEQNVYVKVIDYKSGNQSFDLVALYYGLQLQLVVYLNAAMDMEKKKYPNKKIVPAALLYYHISDPCISTDGSAVTEEEINQNILKELRMKGMVNDDPQIVKLLDSSMTAKSDIIPVDYKKDGSFASTSSVLGEDHLAMVTHFVTNKIKHIGKEILAGDMSVNPYELGVKSACTYCLYTGVCGFDSKIVGFERRKLDAVSSDEALIKIVQEAEFNNNNEVRKTESDIVFINKKVSKTENQVVIINKEVIKTENDVAFINKEEIKTENDVAFVNNEVTKTENEDISTNKSQIKNHKERSAE